MTFDYIYDLIRKHGEYIVETTSNYHLMGNTYMRVIYHFNDGAHLVEYIRKDVELELTLTDDATKNVVNHSVINLKEVHCMASDDRIMHTFYYYGNKLVYYTR